MREDLALERRIYFFESIWSHFGVEVFGLFLRMALLAVHSGLQIFTIKTYLAEKEG